MKTFLIIALLLGIIGMIAILVIPGDQYIFSAIFGGIIGASGTTLYLRIHHPEEFE